jgi:hypothetical protein
MSIGRFVHRLIVISFAAIAAAWSAPIFATVTLPNLPPGSQYQIIFATSDEIGATSGSISTYNTLATTDAAPLNALLPAGVTWHAVGSTLTTAASANAASFSNIPIYNTHGIEVSAGNLYSGSLLSTIQYDENGNPPPINEIWTGATSAGGISANPLGSSFAEFGFSDQTSANWIAGSNNTSSGIGWPIYALSSPITVVPEPGTLSLILVAVVSLGGILFTHRRRNGES